MDIVAITLGISWTLMGMIIIGLAAPLVRGRVGRNSWYGVRFSQSFQSDDAWYAINRYGGRCLIAWAVPLILLGIACFFMPLQSHTRLTLIVGFVPLILVLIPVLQVWRFARRYWPIG